MPSPGETPAPAISGNSTTQTDPTPNFSALPQTALHQLLSLAQESFAGYNQLSASAQSKFQEAQGKIRAVEYSKLPAEAQAKFHEAQDGILAVDFKSLPADVGDWIKAHPYQTAFHVVGGVVVFAPGLVTGPVLGLLGWTSVGPRAGG